MRERKVVRFEGIIGTGMLLRDEHDELFEWHTRNELHPLFTASRDVEFLVSADVEESDPDDFNPIRKLRNVRLVKG